jgi:hypothetical protein
MNSCLSPNQATCRDGAQPSLELGGIGEPAILKILVYGPHIWMAISNDVERFNHVVAFCVVELMQDPGTEGGIVVWHMCVVLYDGIIIYWCVSAGYYGAIAMDLPISSLGTDFSVQRLRLDILFGDTLRVLVEKFGRRG